MSAITRRSFFGASLAGVLAPSADAAPSDLSAGVRKTPDDSPFQPSTLFLTWQRDPTTTMTVQWVGAIGETPDTSVYYRPVGPEPAALASIVGSSRPFGAAAPAKWSMEVSRTKPYPMTDLKVFRTELTGLTPGTDYQFRIGKQSPIYRFRTMPAKATDTFHFISGGDCGVNAARDRQQHPGGASRTRCSRSSAATWATTTAGRSTSAWLSCATTAKHMIGRDGRLIPHGRLHRQSRGRTAATARPRKRRRSSSPLFDGLYPETQLRHARLRRLPEPGAARHRPHLPHRRRSDRLAGQDARARTRPSHT